MSIGGPVAVKYLEDKALGANREEAAMAVRALGQRRDPIALPFALKVAADPKADKLVRDEMFGVIEGIGGLEARKGLLAIISSDKEELVRYRAFEWCCRRRRPTGSSRRSRPSRPAPAYKKVDVDDLLVQV